MFLECTRLWQGEQSGKFTRSLFPTFDSMVLPRTIYSRETITFYYQLRSGHAHCRLRTGYGVSNVLSCRLGCFENESIEHVLIDCNYLIEERKHIQMRCHKL